jgi:NADH-quinone oxidoreductase subunit M
MIFIPLIGALFQTISSNAIWTRLSAVITSLISAIGGVVLVVGMHLDWIPNPLKELIPWMKSYSMNYAVTVDGANALMVLAISFIFPLLIIVEWHRKNARRGLHALFLILQAGALGATCAQDFFLLFFAWVLISLPMYFLVAIFGYENREKAAFKQIGVSSVANGLLFMGVLLVYYAMDPHSFLIEDMMGGRLIDKKFMLIGHEFLIQPVALVLLGLGLALRSAVWPFQGWFKQVAVAVPATVMVALQTVSAPLALTIFIRLSYTLFPNLISDLSPYLIALGMLNLGMSAISMLAEKDLRGVFSYLSQFSVGIVLLGVGTVSSSGMVGAVFFIFSMTLGIAGLGLVAEFLYHRKASYDMNEYGGLIRRIPFIAVAAAIFVACAMGVPGFVGFVGLALVFIGQFSAEPLLAVSSLVFLLLMTGFLFRVYRKVFLGDDHDDARLTTPTGREIAYFLPLLFVVVIVGVLPEFLVEIVRPTLVGFLQLVGR